MDLQTPMKTDVWECVCGFTQTHVLKEQSTAQGYGNRKGKERSQVLIFFTFSVGEKVGRDLQGGERQQVRECC